MNDTTYRVGMGCFAKSQTLQQRFKRALKDLTWLKYEDLCPAVERMFTGESGKRFFRAVIRSGTEKPDQIDRASKLVSAATKINGFYLGMDKVSLHLIVFYQDAVCQPANVTIRLEKFSRLKRIRLH